MKVADGIHFATQEKGGHVHAFLLDDGQGSTLIDALYDADAALILNEIEAMGRKPSDLKNVIATHAHRSHIGGIAADQAPCKVDQTLNEAHRVGPLTIVSTPGHTPGCLSSYWPEKKALFVGDVITTWPRVEAGWRGLTLDMKQNVQSVGKLADFSNIDVVGCGHGESVTEGGREVLLKLRDQKV